ncbi:uncharacterized protein LOC128555744 [Mercenaria mercenaria]|uniref:uncharacterized protein LOC128555744 n=1 Tax=Mercenaria mercenaria TaxID=6596 RepID=UPI00234F1DFE|nr:uncharacterized protein LOC128555744 [Mercenaria mercenaria]XP_053395034.1 uncharacterized protein LOC128555744 [Mercenaria mercenaria]
MKTTDTASLSLFLHAQLDHVGFSKERFQQRIEMYDKRSTALSAATRKILDADHIEKVIVGSRREGLALGNSDTDIMQINHGIVCKEYTDNAIAEKRVVFNLEYQNTPPGYAFLRIKPDHEYNPVYYTSIEYGLVYSRRYLSSDKFVRKNEDIYFQKMGYVASNTQYTERKGPSIPKEVFGSFEIDFVRAFPAHCSKHLDEWLNRDREFEWPSKEVQCTVAVLPAYVVPVGQINSEDRDLQWRISFTPAEIHLVHSLNETQIKLLVLLRLIAKHILAPICPAITSYLMKNVAFWLSEQHPALECREECLFDRLLDALLFLQRGIKRKHLPNYMIPDRNLLAGKMIESSVSHDLVQTISYVTENMAGIVSVCIRKYYNKDAMQRRFPNLCSIANSLKTYEAMERLSIKKTHAVNHNDLVNITIGYFKASNVLMMLWYEICYIIIPYIKQYGWKSMLLDVYIEKCSCINTTDATDNVWNITKADSDEKNRVNTCCHERMEKGETSSTISKSSLQQNFNQNRKTHFYDKEKGKDSEVAASEEILETIPRPHSNEILTKRTNNENTTEIFLRDPNDLRINPKLRKFFPSTFPELCCGTVTKERTFFTSSFTKRKTHTITETVATEETPRSFKDALQAVKLCILSLSLKLGNILYILLILVQAFVMENAPFAFCLCILLFNCFVLEEFRYIGVKDFLEISAMILLIAHILSSEKIKALLAITREILNIILSVIYGFFVCMSWLVLILRTWSKKGLFTFSHFEDVGVYTCFTEANTYSRFCQRTFLNSSSCMYHFDTNTISCDDIQTCFTCK